MTQILGIAGAIVLMLGATAAVGAAIRWLWQTGGKVTRVMDALLGEPPGPGAPEGRPGILERQAMTEKTLMEVKDAILGLGERVSFVEQQMKPNGGGNLRDTVDRVAAAVVVDEPKESTK